MSSNIIRIKDRREWVAVPLEQPLPKEDHPAVIVAVCIGSILLWGGVVFLMLTGGTP